MEYVINEGVSLCKKREKEELDCGCTCGEPKENIIQFSLRITELCNRDCDYCHYHSGVNYETKDILQIIDTCLEHCKDKEAIPLFYFHGGEPTLHEDIEKIIQYIRDNRTDAIIEFQTNFDNPLKVIDLLPNIDRLNISFHFPDEHINVKLKYVKEMKGCIDNIDLIYIPGWDKEIKKLRLLFNALKIKNQLTYSFFQADNYEEDIKRLGIKLTDDELIKNKYFRGEMPSAGLLCDTSNYCIINGDGEIYKCSYALTVKKSYGNIIKNKEALKNTLGKEICPFEYCGYEQAYLKDLQ